MAAQFDQAGVPFDSPLYTFDGTYLGAAAGNLYLRAVVTARNTVTLESPSHTATLAAQNIEVRG